MCTTFVVDLSLLDKSEDIHADDLGSWTRNGKRCSNCEVDGGIVSQVDTGSVQVDGKCVLFRCYYKHATLGHFRKSIAELQYMVKSDLYQ